MSKLKVLVVDDDTELTDQISRVLNESGRYEAIPAYTAKIALETLNKNKKFLGIGGNNIKLILLDIKMPEISGMEFLEKLRDKYDPNIGVIMITAYETMDYWVDSLFAFGAVDYIKKPFTNKELLAQVDRFFKGEAEREEMGREARFHYWRKGDIKESKE